jgi:hypothetical protein
MITHLENWVKKYNIQFQGHNVREWGSYELMMSIDNGQNWILLPQIAGSRLSTIQAFELLLINAKDDVNFNNQLRQLLGDSRMNDLITVEEPTPSEAEIVPKHLYIESNTGGASNDLPMG